MSIESQPTLNEARAELRRSDAPKPAVDVVLGALDETIRICRSMNIGTPGWHLRDQVLAVLDGDQS